MGQEQAYAGCPFRAGLDRLSVKSGGSMQARWRVEPLGGQRFLGETQSSAHDCWLWLVRQRNSGQDLNSSWQKRNSKLWNYLLVVSKIRCVTQTFLRTLSGWDTSSQDGGPTRHTGERQQRYVDFRDVTRRKNTPSKHSASPTRETNVTSGRYGQRLEPCFPTLVDQNEDDMTFLWVLCQPPLHGRHISDKLDLWGRCLGTKVEWEAQLREARFREQQGVRWAAAEGYSLEPEELEKDFRGGVRLRDGRLQANFGDRWWIRCVTILRRNTE